MRVIEMIFAILFWIVMVTVVAGIVFGILYYAYRSLECRDEPFIESEYLPPLPGSQGIELEPCVESESERTVIQELIESKRLCEEALGIYQQIEKVREQLDAKK